MLDQETLWADIEWLAEDRSTDTESLRTLLDRKESGWRTDEGKTLFAVYEAMPPKQRDDLETKLRDARSTDPDSNEWAAVVKLLDAQLRWKPATPQKEPESDEYPDAARLEDMKNEAWHKFKGWWVRAENGEKLFATANSRKADWVNYDTMLTMTRGQAPKQGVQPAGPIETPVETTDSYENAVLLESLPNEAWHQFKGWWVRDENGTKLFSDVNSIHAEWVDYDTMRKHFAAIYAEAAPLESLSNQAWHQFKGWWVRDENGKKLFAESNSRDADWVDYDTMRTVFEGMAPKQQVTSEGMIESPAVLYTWEDFTKDHPEMAKLADIVEELGLGDKDADSFTTEEQVAIMAKFLGVEVSDLEELAEDDVEPNPLQDEQEFAAELIKEIYESGFAATMSIETIVSVVQEELQNI